MKKLTFLILSLALTCVSTAQIIITSADMPNANDSLYVSTTTSLGTHTPSETGSDFTWDYSDLKPLMQQPQKYTGPGKFPSIYNLLFNSFNTSYGTNDILLTSIAIPGVSIEAAYDFYKESTSSLNQIGVGYMINGTPLPFIYKHADVIYKFPLKYLNEDSCKFDFGLGVPGYGYYGQTGRRHTVVDGWGRVKTPLDTYSALRVFSTIDITDTVYNESDSTGFSFTRPTQYQYKWLAANSKIPVLQVDGIMISNQLVYSITFIDSLRKDIIHVGIDENEREQTTLQVYPNPAQEQFTISYKLNKRSQVRIAVSDMLGKEVMPLENETQQAGIYQKSVHVSGLPAGIYFVTLRSDTDYLVKKISIAN